MSTFFHILNSDIQVHFTNQQCNNIWNQIQKIFMNPDSSLREFARRQARGRQGRLS